MRETGIMPSAKTDFAAAAIGMVSARYWNIFVFRIPELSVIGIKNILAGSEQY